MARVLSALALVALLLQPGLPFAPTAAGAPLSDSPGIQTPDETALPLIDESPLVPTDTAQPVEPAVSLDTGPLPPAVTAEAALAGMPGFADPPLPIPYHKPGHPSNIGIDKRLNLAASYQPWAASIAALSPEEALARLEFNADYDPLVSNYNLVEWDNLVVGTPDAGKSRFRTWRGSEDKPNKPPAPPPPAPSLSALKDKTSNAAPNGYLWTGDLNSDGADELLTLSSDASGKYFQVGNFSEQRFIKGAPALAAFSAATVWQLGRGYDDQLWWLRPGKEWEALGGTLTSAPAALASSADRAEVIVRGTGGHLHHCQLAAASTVCAYADLGAPPPDKGSIVGDPAVAGAYGGADWRLDVFMRGSDNSLWHRGRTGWDAWGAWENLGGYITSSPSAVFRDGRIDVAAVGYDGAIWRTYQLNGGAPWSAWERAPGAEAFTAAPAIVSPSPGAFDIYAVDPNWDAAGVASPLLKVTRVGAGATPGWSTVSTVGAAAPASAPAAAVAADGAALFAAYRAADGFTYRGRPGTAAFEKQPQLAEWGLLIKDVGLTLFDIGHFLPNSRMQAINWSFNYQGGVADKMTLRAYSFEGGFAPAALRPAPTVIDLLDHPVNTSHNATSAVGDFDGDGVEELALALYSGGYADLYLLELDGNGTPVKLLTNRVPILTNDEGWAIRLTAGDYDGLNADDEVGLALKKGNQCVLRVWDVERPNLRSMTELAANTDNGCDVGLGWDAAGGNFIKEGEDAGIVDEMAYVGIRFEGGPWFGNDQYHLKRWVFRLKGQPGSWTLEQQGDTKSDVALSVLSGLDDLDAAKVRVMAAAADVQRSGVDKLAVWFEHGKMDAKLFTPWSPSRRWVWTFKYADGLVKWVEPMQVDGDMDKYDPTGVMFAGNLAGQGLRVARPTYRLAPNLGKLVARVSAPPYILDKDGNVLNPDARASLTLGQTIDQKLSLEVKSRWNVDAELEGELGDDNEGPYVKASLKGSYGEDFGSVSGMSQTISFEAIGAARNDMYVYATADAQVFEYAVSDGETGRQSRFTVTTPSVKPINYTIEGAGCSILPAPGHDQRNLLSYAAAPADLPGMTMTPAPSSGPKFLGAVRFDLNQQLTFNTKLDAGNEQEYSKATDWSVTAGIEAGYGGGVGSIKASVEGTYGESATAKEYVSTHKSVEVGGSVELLDELRDDYNLYLWPHIYWDQAGTLTLDYVVQPTETNWWNSEGGWQQPDLAFTQPRKGKSCAPAQGQPRDEESPDITFDATGPLAGKEVTVTALVRSYSLSDVAATVTFYNGDPAQGGAQLCSKEDKIAARSRKAVTCKFTVTGFGEQRIYAVARPTTEVDRDPTNNKAYGVLTVAISDQSAKNADPGLISRKPGVLLGMPTGDEKTTAIYIPYAAMPDRALASFKLERVGARGRGFRISAVTDSDKGGTAEVERQFGLGADGKRDPALPSAWVKIAYTDADAASKGEANLKLLYYDATARKWVDNTAACGAGVLDTANNILQAPVCRTGKYALEDPYMKVYMPTMRR